MNGWKIVGAISSIFFLICVIFYLKTKMPSSPFRGLIDSGQLPEIKKLIEKGEDPNIYFLVGGSTKSKTRPLNYAARIGDLSICKMLIAHGANPNLTDYNKHTPIVNLFTYGEGKRRDQNEIFKLLIPLTDLEAADEDGLTLLHYVALYGSPEQYKVIAELNPHLEEIRDHFGKQPKDLLKDKASDNKSSP